MSGWGILRLAFRLPSLVIWTLGMFVIRMLVRPVFYISPATDINWRSVLFRLWARGTLKIMGGKLKVVGTVPEPPFLLVTNHLSYVDIIASAAITGATFVAKSEIRHWPVIGFCAKHLQTIFIDRDNLRDVVRVKNTVPEIIRQGFGLHIFAEGGISQDLQVKPFKPALLDAAVKNHFPVYYAAITYRTLDRCNQASRSLAWLSDKTFFEHLIGLLSIPGFEVIYTFGESPVLANCRKELAERLTENVRALYCPLS